MTSSTTETNQNQNQSQTVTAPALNLPPKPSDENINSFDIWNDTLWHAKNQEGILPGEIKFCHWEWKPFRIEKNFPVVMICRGHDLLYLRYSSLPFHFFYRTL